MAYLTFAGSDENNTCFKFIGSNTNVNNGGLISDNTSLISNCVSLITGNSDNCLDTCSFYSGPSDSAIMAFGEGLETTGSLAFAGSETTGTIGYSGGVESCGSVASSSVSSGASFSGGGCSYSC